MGVVGAGDCAGFGLPRLTRRPVVSVTRWRLNPPRIDETLEFGVDGITGKSDQE